MTSEEWQRVKAIVVEARMHDAAVRPAFVTEACRGDEALQLEVWSLLDAIEGADSHFEHSALELAGAQSAIRAALRGRDGEPTPGDMIGCQLGAYEIERLLGHGGMGAVFLASRADHEFAHHVAVKIIKRGMDTDAIVSRFRIERQILAALNHPHIGKLLDGGTTPDGLPYLVMEYVEGEPITAYCDARRLTVHDRLVLFRKVCAAVAYAHQNLVVHRDIKPSNVLVSKDAEPKLLDFGLAKILDSEDGLETEAGHRWLTPEFASPEQLKGERVTTVSDVFALGVLLYELLCGRRPFADRGGGTALVRAICEDDPQKPSAVAGGDVPGSVAAARSARPERLSRILRGDLDQIVARALAREPARRYPSAQGLSEDLQRYLNGLPVSAGRGTLSYHAAKFLRRHKAASAAAAAVAVTLVGATAVTLSAARVAQRQRAQAQRRFKDVRHLANAFLFDFHDAIAALPGSTPAREMVIKTAQEYLNSLVQDAGSDRELLSELATAYMKLGDVQGKPSASRTGDTDGALASYTQALALRRRLVESEPLNTRFEQDLAVALVRMGPVYQVRGDPARAIIFAREGMGIIDRLLTRVSSADVRRDGFRAPLYLGDALFDAGDYAGALAMFEKALRVAETARQDPPETDYRYRIAVARERLGIMLMITGDPRRALDSFRDALANEEAMQLAEPGNATYLVLTANGNYYVGDALSALGQHTEAIATELRAHDMYENLLRADPRNAGAKKDIGGSSHKIAEVYLASGNPSAARPFLEDAIAIRRELALLDKGSVEYLDDLAESLTLQGERLLAGRDARGAVAAFEEARAIREPLVSSRPGQAMYTRGLARSYTGLADAYTLGAQHASSREAAADARRQARDTYRKGLDLWIALRAHHELWTREAARPEDVAKRLAALGDSN